MSEVYAYHKLEILGYHHHQLVKRPPRSMVVFRVFGRQSNVLQPVSDSRSEQLGTYQLFVLAPGQSESCHSLV